MKDHGDLCCSLGIHVEKEGIIYLDKRKYIQQVLQNYGISDFNTFKTPIDLNTK